MKVLNLLIFILSHRQHRREENDLRRFSVEKPAHKNTHSNEEEKEKVKQHKNGFLIVDFGRKT